MAAIRVIISAVSVVSAVCVTAWKHATCRGRAAAADAAIRRLYEQYVADIGTLTQAYLFQAPSDEEWLAGIKMQVDAPFRHQESELLPPAEFRTARRTAAPTTAGLRSSPIGNGHHRSREARSAGRPYATSRNYLSRTAAADLGCASIGVFAAIHLRFGSTVTGTYLALSLALPVFWLAAIWLAGGYDVRFIGTGSDELLKVLSAGVGLTAVVALFSYAAHFELSRGYLVIALPSITLLDLTARYAIRKGLPTQRASRWSTVRIMAVGHEQAVADLVRGFQRGPYRGLSVVGACVARPSECSEIAGVPVCGGLDDVTAAVRIFDANTVAVLACPEIDSVRLRGLAWELEKTGTDLWVSPALMDVAGPRTTVRTTAGLTFLQVDHLRLAGVRLILKGLFDRCAAVAALILLAPLTALLRNKPTAVTPSQLIRVLRGDMSLVGPRPQPPDEESEYVDHVRQRLGIKPGVTGLWQVNGKSDLSWNEDNLDLHYMEDWSFSLDLKILWERGLATLRGSAGHPAAK
jgi:hypothetical protein